MSKWGEDGDITDFDEVKHSSAAYDTVHSQPFFRETKTWSEKQLVVSWAYTGEPCLFPWLCFCSVVFFTEIYFSYQSFQPSKQALISVLCLCICVSVCFLGAWTFLWFVCFCLLASQWSHTQDVSGIPEDAARATVAFSFFSIATWVSGTAAFLVCLKTFQILFFLYCWTLVCIKILMRKIRLIIIVNDFC